MGPYFKTLFDKLSYLSKAFVWYKNRRRIKKKIHKCGKRIVKENLYITLKKIIKIYVAIKLYKECNDNVVEILF